MLKLLLCVACGLIVAVTILHLRQQRLELNYEANKLHTQIEKSQAKLWNQQLQIAVYTAPNAIAKTVDDQKMDMVPEKPQPAVRAPWIDLSASPDAE